MCLASRRGKIVLWTWWMYSLQPALNPINKLSPGRSTKFGQMGDKICNVQQGFPFWDGLEAQKYAIYNKNSDHFDLKNMQFCNLHIGELPGACMHIWQTVIVLRKILQVLKTSSWMLPEFGMLSLPPMTSKYLFVTASTGECQQLAWLEVRDTQVVTIGLRQQPSLNEGT